MNINDEEIVELFFDVGRLNLSYSESKYGNVNPYKGQSRCLLFLDRNGSINQKDLAEQLSVRQSSVSDILSKLEQKGFIKKTPSDKDKRITLISLTDKGKEEVVRIRKDRAKAHSEMLTDLNEKEKESFFTILQKIKNFYLSKEEEKQKNG